MLETIVVILIVLWLFGFFGPAIIPAIPQTGNLIHIVLVVAAILLIFSLLSRRR